MAIATPDLRVFLSHSWKDKPLARRIAYRLRHRGVPVWIDESELAGGDQLPERLEAEIRAATHVAVLVTPDAIGSRWVSREIAAALVAPGQPQILPLTAAPGVLHPDLAERWVAEDISDPLEREAVLDRLAALLPRVEPSAVGARDRALLDTDLDAMAARDPALGRLLTILRSAAPDLEAARSAAAGLGEPEREAAETALVTLVERSGAGDALCALLPEIHAHLGIGFPAMATIVARGSAEERAALFFGLDVPPERDQDLEGHIRLFELAARHGDRYDRALARTVERCFTRLSPAQVQTAVDLFCEPRPPLEGHAMELAYALFARLPQVTALETLWHRWATSNCMMAVPERRKDLLFHLARAEVDGFDHFGQVRGWLRGNHKACLRGTDPELGEAAVFLLEEARQRAPSLADILAREQCDTVMTDSARWVGEDWTLQSALTDHAKERPGSFAAVLAALTAVRNQEPDSPENLDPV